MLGDTNVPIKVRQSWVWDEMARFHPEIKPACFGFDDPFAFHEIIVRDTYRFKAFPGARVMDIGANVGVFTALCAINGALVDAYEPNYEAFTVLNDTIARNSLQSSVFARPVAIWSESGQCPFHRGKTVPDGSGARNWTSYNGSVVWPEVDVNPELVPCLSLTEALGTLEWDCVKIDIEGAEFEVLFAATDEALRKIKYLTLEIHNGWADKVRHDILIARLAEMFIIEGVKEGDSRFAGENRWISVYATRKL